MHMSSLLLASLLLTASVSRPEGEAPVAPATTDQTQPAPTDPASWGNDPKATEETGKRASGGMADILPMIVIMGVLFYFMILRPQKREEKARKEMLSALAKNDHVVTASGIHGVIASVTDEEIVLKVDESKDVRIRFSRSAIARRVDEAAEKK